MTLQDQVTKLVARTLQGGATIDPRTGLEPARGFVVAIAPEGPGQTIRVDSRTLAPYELDAAAAWALTTARNLGACAGSWFDAGAGEYVFDIVEVLPDIELALAAGLANHQAAIYDLHTRQVVEVPHA
jgi:hypothetical protein